MAVEFMDIRAYHILFMMSINVFAYNISEYHLISQCMEIFTYIYLFTCACIFVLLSAISECHKYQGWCKLQKLNWDTTLTMISSWQYRVGEKNLLWHCEEIILSIKRHRVLAVYTSHEFFLWIVMLTHQLFLPKQPSPLGLSLLKSLILIRLVARYPTL